MKNDCFTKESLFIMCFLMNCLVSIQAQNEGGDNICLEIRSKTIPDNTHRLRLKAVLIPTIVVGAAGLFVKKGWFAKQRKSVQNVFSAKGKNKFRLDEYIQYSPMVAVYGLNLTGLKGKHAFKDRTIILAMSYVTMGILVNIMKLSFQETRPDSNARNSFPSGHTATAFMGAEFLYREYKDVSPWIGYIGYAIAATTGYLRIYNNRHYVNDVIAGACIGILSTKLVYWLYPKVFKKSDCNKQVIVIGLPYYSTKEAGLSLCVFF